MTFNPVQHQEIKMKQKETVIFNQTESVLESWSKDAITLGVMVLCVWVSRDSAWWTFFTGCFALAFFFAKAASIWDTRRTVIKSKADALAWAESLPDDASQ